MNFSGVPNQSIAGRLLRLPLGLIPPSTVLPILQGPLKGHKWIAGSSTHGCWLGSYEFQKQQQFITHIRPGNVVYDIGAHVGFYTLLSAKLTGNAGKVIAFEPFPPNMRFLKQHVEMNKLTNVTLYEKALSNRTGKATFEIGPSSSMGHLSSNDNVTNSVSVELIELDRFIDEMQLPLADVIKVDIEGAEADFLEGARGLLTSRPITMFLATHGIEVHTRCLSLLKNFGYEVTSLDDRAVETTDEVLAMRSK